MTLLRRRALHTAATAAAFAVSTLMLAGCATAASDSPASPAFGEVRPAPPTGEVMAQGTVLADGDTVALCLGPVAESFPPQCDGIELTGWSWDDVQGFETSGDVTWGTYALPGHYDGETFAATGQAIMLALYDPMMREDPTGGRAGSGDDAALTRASDVLAQTMGDEFLSSHTQDGWLWVDVVWDDGTWQQAADAEFGTDMIVVRSALQPIDR